MKITVNAFSDYKKYLPADASSAGWEIDVADGSTIEEVLLQKGIPLDAPKLFTVNDSNQKSDYVLRRNDVLKIFPLAMGG